MNLNIIHVHETSSTNTCLKEWSDQHPDIREITALYTDNQIAGKGQRGNSWEAEAGKNLTASFYLTPLFIAPDRQFVISQIVSLALKDVLSAYVPDITIKWPNDIYYRDKKICGILIENDISESAIIRSIIGIGLNVNQRTFRSNPPNPVSLVQITGQEYGIEAILKETGENICLRYSLLKQSSGYEKKIQEEYRNALYRRTGFHLFESEKGIFQARIHSVQTSGILVLEREDNGSKESFAFKEVRYIL